MAMGPTELSRKWFHRVWNLRDREMIDRLMAEDCELLGLPADPDVPGRQHFVEFWNAMGAFRAVHVEVLEVVECGDRAIGHCRFTGSHSSGAPVDFTFSFSGVWQDGQVVETRNVVDFFTMLCQVGELRTEQLTSLLGTA